MNRAVLAVLSLTVTAVSPTSGSAQDTDGLLSLDSLLNIRISAAARHEQTTREAAASTVVVTRDDFLAYGWQSVAEVVSSVAGFYTTSDRTYEYLGARGFGRLSDYNNRVLLLVDGRPANGIMNAQADMGTGLLVPLEHVERVEVVRGPGSALYGSSAMLAVVNVVTRSSASGEDLRIGVERDNEGVNRAVVSIAGRAGSEVEYSAYANWREDPGADVYFPEFDSQGLGDGWARKRDHWSGKTAGVTLSSMGLRLDVLADDIDLGDPTAPYYSSFVDGATRSSNRLWIRSSYSGAVSPRARLEVGVGYLSVDQDATFHYDEPFDDALAFFGGSRWRGDGQLSVDLSPSHRLTFGAEVTSAGPGLEVGPSSANLIRRFRETVRSASGFAQHEWQATGRLSFVVGARIDDYSTVGSALSPRGAAVYHVSDATTLKFLYGEAFRAPTPLELFVEEPGVLKANPMLGPEKIRTVEVVWEHRLAAGLFATASAYDYRMRDLITQALDPDERVLTYQNLAHVRGRGIELAVTGRMASGVTFYGNTTLQHTWDVNTDEEAVNSPSYLFRAGASTPLPFGFRLGVNVSGDADRRTYGGADTESVWLAGFRLNAPSVAGMSLSVTANNLFDASYGFPAGLEHRQVAIPQRGRSIRFALTAEF
jgi:outer membrane receptor protein involved in Fe transport